MTALDLVILSLVVWRVTRFIQLDSMFEDTRDRLAVWLMAKRQGSDGRRHTVYRKALDLMTCALCVSVWIAAAVLALWCWATGDWLGWRWPFWWLASASGAMVVYRYTDPPN